MKHKLRRFLIQLFNAPIFLGAFLFVLLCSTISHAESDAIVRFVSYNLKNYLPIERGGETRFKPEGEINALLEILAKTKPDVLAVSEIGKLEDLIDLQKRLQQRDIGFLYYAHTGGSDPDRHLGILSKYPLSQQTKNLPLKYDIAGRTQHIRRGILDTTIETPIGPIRFLGIHFKSKRPVSEFDQALIRRNEAHLLRKHISNILESEPNTKLLVHGDFNDTKNSTTIRAIKIAINSPHFLEALNLKDSNEHKWTHYWKSEDIYSRFDWVFYNEALKPHIDQNKSKIIDHTLWNQASDHRPILVILK